MRRISMDRIIIDPKKALVDEDSVQDYIDVLNGIARYCTDGGYREGTRNEIAVNLTVASHELGMDAIEILRLFMNHGLIDKSKDDESTEGRVNRVLWYTKNFSWDYMLDPGFYCGVGTEEDERHLNCPLVFVVESFK
jgi:hypothetical protein